MMLDLRYLRRGDLIRVERDGVFMFGMVQSVARSERFPEREITLLPCVPPGVPFAEIKPWLSCLRSEIAGVWRADTQTRRAREGVDAYMEWAMQVNSEVA